MVAEMKNPVGRLGIELRTLKNQKQIKELEYRTETEFGGLIQDSQHPEPNSSRMNTIVKPPNHVIITLKITYITLTI